MSHNYDTLEVVARIKDNLRLPPNQFQQFLQNLPYSYDVFLTIAQLMNALSDKEEKQKMATSFNFLVSRNFKNQDKCPDGWRVFQQQIATKQKHKNNTKGQISDWKLANITQKSFEKFVQSFEQQFTPILQQIYFKLNLNHKILLQQMIPRGDINQVARQLFLQQTFQQYIGLGLDQLSQIHNLNQEQRQQQLLQQRFIRYLKSLRQTLVYLNYQSVDNKQISYLTNKVCASQQLYILVKQCIYFDFSHRDCKINDNKTNGSDNSQNSNSNGTKEKRYKPLFQHSGTAKRQQTLNDIKAVSLQIFCLMLNRYSSKAGVAEFDQSKVLTLMENIIPHLIEELVQSNPNKLSLKFNQKLTIAMLNTIKKSMSFLFMNDFHWNNYRKVFWRIVYPLLHITDQELRQYQDDPQDFIAQSETLIQKQQDDPEIVESCKTYAAFLLDFMINAIDGALTTVSDGILALLSYKFSGNDNDACRDIMRTYSVKESLQTCFTVLSILSAKIKRREDILQQIRNIFSENKSQLLSLRKIEKAHLLIFLNYNFAQVFRQSAPKQKPIIYSRSTRDYYEMIAQTLEQDEILTKLSVTFFMDYHSLQTSTQIILTQIIDLIPRTKSIDILEAIPRILFDSDQLISYDTVKKALDMSIERIMNDNLKYMRAIQKDEVYSNICMLKCLHIVGAIAFNYSRAPGQGQSQEIMGMVWKVFDLMENIAYANYGEQLIKMFGVVLTFIRTIDRSDFYQFLDVFGAYSAKNQQIGVLFRIYLILLMKGQRYLKQTSEGQSYLQQIVDNCLIIVGFHFRNRSTIAINLLQYILITFPNNRLDHKQIYNRTEQLLCTVSNLKHQNITAIFNLWIIGSSLSSAYNLGELDRLSPQAIFGYQAKIFAIAIDIKVKQLCSDLKRSHNCEDDINRISFLVRKSVQFVRVFEQKNRKKNGQIQQKIEQFNMVCPNQKIKSAILTIKNSLSQRDYGFIIRDIQNYIPMDELKRLLNNAGQQQRIVFKIRQS